MTTGAFSQNVGKLFSKLKLVTDNLLFIYAEANWEATENYSSGQYAVTTMLQQQTEERDGSPFYFLPHNI